MTGAWQADVSGGGTGNLSGLTTVTEPGAVVQFMADGAGSTLNLSPLTSFAGASLSKFVVTNSATVLASSLTNFNNVDITLDGTNTQVANSWTTVTGGTPTLPPRLLPLQKLTSIQAPHSTAGGRAPPTAPAPPRSAGGLAGTPAP